MGIRDLLFVGLVLGATAAIGSTLYPRKVRATHEKSGPPAGSSDKAAAATVNASFRKLWSSEGLHPSAPAPELAVVRRLSLGLTGTIPSLEELRGLEDVAPGQKIDRWIEILTRSRRSADYLAERFARAYVGTEGGPFLVYRRRRFIAWLSDQFHSNRPYDQIVRDLIETDGLWTDHPATNFLTVTYDPDREYIDPERVAGRVARAFLGIRIDCAQCHDHPFERWTQKDFQGLAAFFGQSRSGFIGIHDGPGEFQPIDRKTAKPVTVEPRVPFRPELLPDGKARRPRLAKWITDPKNLEFARATVNRVWGILFGRPLVDPVDDIGSVAERPEALDLLANDFVAHGYDLRRLIRVAASTEVFRLDSALDTEATDAHEPSWAVFPITRLRPDQVVGSLLQTSSLTTIDTDSPIIVRFARAVGESEFVQRYGDSGEDEFDGRSGTIPQRLLMMNGKVVNERTKSSLFVASTRIGYFAPTDRAAIDLAYRIALTRDPTAEERTHFESKIVGTKGDQRGERMSDLIWTLVNASEFSWCH